MGSIPNHVKYLMHFRKLKNLLSQHSFNPVNLLLLIFWDIERAALNFGHSVVYVKTLCRNICISFQFNEGRLIWTRIFPSDKPCILVKRHSTLSVFILRIQKFKDGSTYLKLCNESNRISGISWPISNMTYIIRTVSLHTVY